MLNPAVELNVPPAKPVIVGVGSVASTQYAAALYENEASSNALIVTDTPELFGQVPAVVYVTVYVPGVDVLTSIAPVPALILNPAVELNVPPAKPVIVGVGSVASTQYAAAL